MLAFIIVIGVVVFVHEFGHYIVGRWTGIHAETFSLGMGPVIWSRTDKRGTKWQLAAVPIGGYVKFVGDRSAASDTDHEALDAMSEMERSRSFPAAKVLNRALTVAAGPFANFLLASLLFAGLILWQGISTDTTRVGEILAMPNAELNLKVGDEVLEVNGQSVASFGDIIDVVLNMDAPGDMELLVLRNGEEVIVVAPYLLPPAVFGVEPLSAASLAGLEAGDVVLEADGQAVNAFSDLQTVILASGDKEILLKVWREGEVINLPITPVFREFPNGDGDFEDRVMIGVYGALSFLPASETPAPWRATYLGVQRTGNVISTTMNALKHMFIGNLSPTNLQGPVGIAQMSKETANQGLISFISMIAVISTGIGLLNLFPVPMLDGGHLVFFAYETVRGQPPSKKTIQALMSIGLAMMLLLMVFTTYNDVMRL